MPHPCKTDFWGDGVGPFIEWLDYLDTALPQYDDGRARYLSLPTWQSLCVLQSALEIATGTIPSPPPPWFGGGGIDPGAETEFRQVTQVLTALLVADQYDTVRGSGHDPLAWAWMSTPPGSGNPEQGAMDVLVGPTATPVQPESGSLLGRIKNALGG